MTVYLYNIWLQEPAVSQPEGSVQANVQSAGLLEEGGSSVERIGVNEIDLTYTGQFRLGERFSPKHANEVESIAKSDYESVPLYGTGDDATYINRGYYEVLRADTNPAQATTGGAFQYVAALQEAGTRKDHWRAVTTNVESIGHGLTAGGATSIGVDSEHTKGRWWSAADGKEDATVARFRNGEFGDADQYDPADSSISDPTLIFEVDYDQEWRMDSRVWDDVGEADKTWTVTDSDGDTASATQWHHVYHTQWEFDGDPIVENGLIRIQFNESSGDLEVEEWDTSLSPSDWASLSFTQDDYDLFDTDLMRIGPADVRVYTEWEDTTDGSIHPVVLSVQRGIDEAIMRIPENESSIPTDLENQLSPIVSDQDNDPNPQQTLVRRAEVR